MWVATALPRGERLKRFVACQNWYNCSCHSVRTTAVVNSVLSMIKSALGLCRRGGVMHEFGLAQDTGRSSNCALRRFLVV